MKRRLIIALLAFSAVAPAQLKVFVGGNWWRNQATVDRLHVTPEQQKKLEDVFQQNRVRLIDHTAAVDREEVIMEQLMAADSLDVTKVRLQIDKVAEARAQLEKTNANMLLDMRALLTKDQWDAMRPKSGRRGPMVQYFETSDGRGATGPTPKPKR
jgi:Spy/CpxP family protein refolding chaperone